LFPWVFVLEEEEESGELEEAALIGREAASALLSFCGELAAIQVSIICVLAR
jgi:hypothetical protein